MKRVSATREAMLELLARGHFITWRPSATTSSGRVRSSLVRKGGNPMDATARRAVEWLKREGYVAFAAPTVFMLRASDSKVNLTSLGWEYAHEHLGVPQPPQLAHAGAAE